jgi:WD40 repeat protein
MDYTSRIWDVESGKMIREWKTESGGRCVSLASGDKRLAILVDPAGDQPSTVLIFDTTSSDRPIAKIPMPSMSRANRALWGPLNKSIITSNEAGALMSWDPASGECLIKRNDHTLAVPDFTFHQKDQMTLITGSTDMTATVIIAEFFVLKNFHSRCVAKN